jgi:hypothetical protein
MRQCCGGGGDWIALGNLGKARQGGGDPELLRYAIRVGVVTHVFIDELISFDRVEDRYTRSSLHG